MIRDANGAALGDDVMYKVSQHGLLPPYGVISYYITYLYCAPFLLCCLVHLTAQCVPSTHSRNYFRHPVHMLECAKRTQLSHSKVFIGVWFFCRKCFNLDAFEPVPESLGLHPERSERPTQLAPT